MGSRFGNLHSKHRCCECNRYSERPDIGVLVCMTMMVMATVTMIMVMIVMIMLHCYRPTKMSTMYIVTKGATKSMESNLSRIPP